MSRAGEFFLERRPIVKRQRVGEADVDDRSFYVCTVEYFIGGDMIHHYRVHAIKLRDLFSFHAHPIILYSSESKLKSETTVVRYVDCICSDDDELLPLYMGFGVLGSQIVLAGGWGKYAKVRDAPKPSYTLDTTDPEAKFVRSVNMDMDVREMVNPWLEEIQGKLYALSDSDFKVFDPKTQVWASLPPPPVSDYPGVSVSGTKIFATFAPVGDTYCFDVASSPGSWEPDVLSTVKSDFIDRLGFDLNYMILDSEEDDLGKLVFSYDGNTQVHRISHELPFGIKHVASIGFPHGEVKVLPYNDRILSYRFIHLGGRKICFSSIELDAGHVHAYHRTLEFTYSSKPPGALNSSSSSDPFSSSSGARPLSCISHCGSFSAKALGRFHCKYNYTESSTNVSPSFGGCFVL